MMSQVSEVSVLLSVALLVSRLEGLPLIHLLRPVTAQIRSLRL